jgi:hypothetical protein
MYELLRKHRITEQKTNFEQKFITISYGVGILPCCSQKACKICCSFVLKNILKIYIFLLTQAAQTAQLTIFGSQGSLTLKGPKAICKPFLKFGQAIVKAIFIKNSQIKL